MAEQAISRTNDARESSASADSTAANVIGRLVPPANRDTDTAPQTPDELIDAFCDGYGYATRDELIELIESGVFHIYRANDIYALVEFVPTKYGKTLNVLTVVGNKSDWDVGIRALDSIARMNDAKYIYSVGHLGWEKSMRQHGYKTERVLRMSKEAI